jgi:hypothetical protein
MGTIKKNTDEIILEIYKYSDSVQTITGLQDGHDKSKNKKTHGNSILRILKSFNRVQTFFICSDN